MSNEYLSAEMERARLGTEANGDMIFEDDLMSEKDHNGAMRSIDTGEEYNGGKWFFETEIDKNKEWPTRCLLLFKRTSGKEWIEWAGGKIPVSDHEDVVEVFHRDGTFDIDDAVSFRWKHTGSPVDIIKYRLHTPEQEKSNGLTADYYELPANAKQLQDLISFKDMNAQVGESFRSLYRYGQSSHSDRLRDAKKVLFYMQAEIERLEKYE